MLSDIGSWSSIIALILAFIIGFGVCRFTMKKNNQENKNSSMFNKGDVNQSNNNRQ